VLHGPQSAHVPGPVVAEQVEPVAHVQEYVEVAPQRDVKVCVPHCVGVQPGAVVSSPQSYWVTTPQREVKVCVPHWLVVQGRCVVSVPQL
jgi:hypothetical protein